MPLGAFKAALMGTAGVSTGADVVLLATETETSTSLIEFTSGITSTYGEYIFGFYNINPETDGQSFTFQVNAAGAADYNEAMVTTSVSSYHQEAAGATGPTVVNSSAADQVGTAYQALAIDVDNAADSNASGVLHLFNPSSTTFVKHFISRMNGQQGDATNFSWDHLAAGYINITLAIDEVSFKMASGDFSGTIKMWGVK